MKKTIAAALTVAVLATSATFATTNASQAGYYGGYHKGYGYGYGYKFRKHCYWKKIKVWGYYGYHWKKIRVCH